jgi:hypothetical protein
MTGTELKVNGKDEETMEVLGNTYKVLTSKDPMALLVGPPVYSALEEHHNPGLAFYLAYNVETGV